MNGEEEYYEDLCRRANTLITSLQLCSNQDLVDYITAQINECGYCDIEDFNKGEWK